MCIFYFCGLFLRFKNKKIMFNIKLLKKHVQSLIREIQKLYLIVFYYFLYWLYIDLINIFRSLRVSFKRSVFIYIFKRCYAFNLWLDDKEDKINNYIQKFKEKDYFLYRMYKKIKVTFQEWDDKYEDFFRTNKIWLKYFAVRYRNFLMDSHAYLDKIEAQMAEDERRSGIVSLHLYVVRKRPPSRTTFYRIYARKYKNFKQEIRKFISAWFYLCMGGIFIEYYEIDVWGYLEFVYDIIVFSYTCLGLIQTTYKSIFETIIVFLQAL